MSLFLEVALPVPLRDHYTYAFEAKASESLIMHDDQQEELKQEAKQRTKSPQIGSRVVVPFRSRELIGIVTSVSEHCQYDTSKIKPIIRLLDQEAFIPSELLLLCQWGAKYYHHPLGEVIQAVIPLRYREGKEYEADEVYTHTPEGKGLPFEALKRAKKQQEIHQYLLEHTYISPQKLKSRDFSSNAIKGLIDKGLVQQTALATSTEIEANKDLLKEEPRTLTDEQNIALQQIRYHTYNCYLVEGATGSGKTELYMHIVARVLQAKQQVLVLIPEIGLSPQTVKRFRARFNVNIVELHSNVSEAARARNWWQAKSGQAQIVIGTRLASLTPFKNLGAIIVDEEHDRSYKQQDGFKYSARDLSVFRAHTLKIPIILGSATPSLESLHNAESQRYQKLVLNLRAGGAKMPEIKTTDLRQANLVAGLSQNSLHQLKQTLENHQQVLVFVNRRGYAPALLCHNCGWSAQCPSCDMRMTLHNSPRHLRCHYCDRSTRVPISCPSCKSKSLQTSGYGTEQIEQILAAQFPNVPVVRIDRDSIRTKQSMEKKLLVGESAQACIFVGTQMLAKGHHLPHLTLVIVADTDQGLLSPDFRTLEHMGQLITQVSGRAGRGENAGTVLLQTHRPDHPMLQILIEQGYAVFARELLTQRYQSNLPPFWHMAAFRSESKRADNSLRLLEQIAQILQRLSHGVDNIAILGPHAAAVEKINERYRFVLQIKSASRNNLQRVLSEAVKEIDQLAMSKRARWSIDVNPVEM